MSGKRELPCIRATVLVSVLLLIPIASPLAAQIQDNSFLLEEAYNQERGVVQHISTFARGGSGDWNFGFTQEWPLGGIRHQLSYTIPIAHGEAGTGLGDLALNYRHQLVGDSEARTVIAPRLTLLLPTGDAQAGRGAGAVGVQGNLPLTINLHPALATHWNAGFTLIPSAHGPGESRATTLSHNLGGSVVWLAQPRFNVLVEVLWLADEVVAGSGSTTRNETLVVSPGVRMAFDLAGDLQIVPGVAYTVGLTEESGEDSLFLYLSFEHPFSRQ